MMLRAASPGCKRPLRSGGLSGVLH